MIILLVVLIASCRYWLSDADVCADSVQRTRWHADRDGDGYGDPKSQGRCAPAEGLVDNADDCDDGDPNLGSIETIGEQPGLTLWCRDDDQDGVGRSDDCLHTCDPPEGYEAPESGDCDDDNPYFTVVCPWVSVSTAWQTSCGLREDGSIGCWGYDWAQVVSDAPTDDGFRDVSVGVDMACAVDDDGTITCWGFGAVDPPDDIVATAVAAGYGNGCALDEAGAVHCWSGRAAYQYPQMAERAPAGDGFVSVTVDWGSACAIDADGRLTCWAADDFDEIADDAPAGEGFTRVAIGNDHYTYAGAHACAVAAGGSLECWGDSRLEPDVLEPPDGDDFVDVDVEYLQAAALRADGTVAQWGDFLDPETTGDEVPDDAVGIAVGAMHVCALRSSGRVTCWGDPSVGATQVIEPGLATLAAGGVSTCGTTLTGSDLRCWGEPLEPHAADWLTIDAEYETRCGLHVGGRLDCWTASSTGSNGMPEGSGFQDVFPAGWFRCAVDEDGAFQCWSEDDIAPTPPSGTGWLDWDGGYGFACALDTAGAVDCWGNVWGGIGDWPTDAGFTDITAASSHACALDAEGAITCWGEDVAVGAGQTYDEACGTPTGDGYVAVAAGVAMDCALHADGTIACWLNGEAGRKTPSDDDFVAVGSGGSKEACGLHSDGTVSCWVESGGYSQLTGSSTPRGAGWDRLFLDTSGHSNACVIDGEGAATCWGGNERVLSSTEDLAAPSLGEAHGCALWRDQVRCFGSDGEGQADAPLDAFVSVGAGGDHSCAIDGDGGVTCWGADDAGQSSPPGGLGAVAALALGRGFTCALREDGSLSCWGEIDDPPGGEWAGLTSGRGHACAIDQAGGVTCWGADDLGQATVPADLPPAVQVAAGDFHTCALGADGYPTCWGLDSYRQDADPKVRFTALAAGGEHTCGIRLDGLPWCWGRDLEGQATPPEPDELAGD